MTIFHLAADPQHVQHIQHLHPRYLYPEFEIAYSILLLCIAEIPVRDPYEL